MATPARQLLFAIPIGLQVVGSFERIQKFLQLGDEPISREITTIDSKNSKGQIPEKDQQLGSSLMFQDTHATVLHHKNGFLGSEMVDQSPTSYVRGLCNFRGSFTAITGPIGCGKSTLLKGLLTEDIFAKEASQASSDGIAYCSQTPWIHDGSIRDNIIGESGLDSTWYKDVVRSCELEFDLSRMPEGDATMVGSRGQMLSGGQKQRIVRIALSPSPCSVEHTIGCMTLTGFSLLLEPCTPKIKRPFSTTSQMHLILALSALW